MARSLGGRDKVNKGKTTVDPHEGEENYIDESAEDDCLSESGSIRVNPGAETSRSTLFYSSRIVPILQVEVRISDKIKELCTIFEGQTAEEIADMIAAKHQLEKSARDAIVSELEIHLSELQGAS